jgi:GNAT superfamily N-acetyltransferase
VAAWPPAVCERFGDGWLLRATPGLDRGRSNHALTPAARPLASGELEVVLERVREFAARHGTRVGIQVSPLSLHAGVVESLLALGWSAAMSVEVLIAPVGSVAEGASLELTASDAATPEWLAAWAACEGRDAASVQAHASTVFAGLRGRASFVRSVDEQAVGVSVDSDGLIGLFCLAVAPSARRGGVGSALVRGMLSPDRCGASTAYLQVEASNAPALALYERLGLAVAYGYIHCVAPAG